MKSIPGMRLLLPVFSRSFPRSLLLLMFLAGFLMLSGGISAQTGDLVYVKIDGAKLRADTGATSAVVADLAKGAELRVIERAGTRYKVSEPGGKVGYIARLHITETKPAGGGGLLSGLGRSEVRASEAEAVASIRGLSPAAKAMAQQQQAPEKCIEWAEMMETRSNAITAAEAQDFLKSAGVGL